MINFNLSVAPDYELMITSFHEMRHIYQYCCIDFGYKLIYKKYFNEPKARVEKKTNLEAAATKFLLNAGMNESEILSLKEKLS